jgi:hypothetical protein
MNSWRQAGAPVNRGRQTWDLDRQVRLAAGSVVAASVLGSALQPGLKWIGAGLVAAAISDTCVLGMALAKMPWNRPATDIDVGAVLHALSSNA